MEHYKSECLISPKIGEETLEHYLEELKKQEAKIEVYTCDKCHFEGKNGNGGKKMNSQNICKCKNCGLAYCWDESSDNEEDIKERGSCEFHNCKYNYVGADECYYCEAKI